VETFPLTENDRMARTAIERGSSEGNRLPAHFVAAIVAKFVAGFLCNKFFGDNNLLRCQPSYSHVSYMPACYHKTYPSLKRKRRHPFAYASGSDEGLLPTG
jgi:hypothetical protein